ncbi:hypothetical protein UN63_05530 [Oceanisphaera arctica]|uniref:Uncharacterized protein n=1 Tax=Oceanisphaera arctica TaxID=641510 RepID=A0A2P5TNV1_9GAMM|nr:hypothetical protein UN63_05530 [Oceanisphaera arctica]
MTGPTNAPAMLAFPPSLAVRCHVLSVTWMCLKRVGGAGPLFGMKTDRLFNVIGINRLMRALPMMKLF